ncbi:MAG: hypothetical protein JW749_06965 [Sedimentisphaerales bacterium]|nr:hypothetical protein [Sedimentisphaerales bacterium]
MRAEHRHELKTNELAEWIGEMPTWIKQHLRMIVYVSVVVVFVVGYSLYYRYQTTIVARREQTNLTGILSQLPQSGAVIARAQAGGDDRSYELLQIAQALENIAGGAKQDEVAALALIKEAEIQRTEIHFRMGDVSREDFAGAITRAKNNYTKALDILKRKPNTALEAMARMGLGLCEEDLGNFEQAGQLYKEVATGSTYEGTTSAEAAKNRLALMDYFNRKITLKPAPAPPLPVQPAGQEQISSLVPRVEAVVDGNARPPNP